MCARVEKKGRSRCSLDIVRDILVVAKEEARKTRIMYQANLNFLQLEKYLDLLLESGLLDRNGSSYYSASGKGLEFLRMYDEYVDQCRLIAEQVERSNRERAELERMFSNRFSVSEQYS